jgi:ferredoxin-type protein NapF
MARDISRRQFFRFAGGRSSKSQIAPVSGAGDTPAVVRPPGAGKNASGFLAACDRCGRCLEACPFDAIVNLGPEFGNEENTPAMVLNESPCHWCASLDCGQACPTGALSYNPDGGVDPLAKAKLNLDACLAQQGILCDDCVVVCPTTAGALRLQDRTPRLLADRCVGCGLCAAYCPAEPNAISIQPVPPDNPDAE